jgi:hypothetical protein
MILACIRSQLKVWSKWWNIHKQDQEGITTPLSKNLALQVNAKVEGHMNHKLKCR